MAIAYHNNFLESIEEYSEAKQILFSAPYDGTVSFMPGTRFAGNAIREASLNLEDYSPYLDKTIQEVKLFDAGELEFESREKTALLAEIEDYTRKIIKDGKKPIMIGGEHLVTLPVVKALSSLKEEIALVQLDAHADLRKEYCGEKLSHATVMSNSLEQSHIKEFWQLGIRSGTKEEFKEIKKRNSLLSFSKEDLAFLKKQLESKKIYITIDLDVFDPAYLPGTGTPEPGGINFHDFISFVKAMRGLDIVGFDTVELNPMIDQGKRSAMLAAKVIREMSMIL